MRKVNYLYTDFETTVVDFGKKYVDAKDYYENSPNVKYPQVYSWAVLYDHDLNISKYKNVEVKENKQTNDKFKVNYDISGDSFIRFVESIETDCIMYFNNLKKFDGHFILPLLDKNGYKNVLPLDIKQYMELDDKVQFDYEERLIRIRKEILANKHYKDKYNELLKEDKKEADKYLKYAVKRKWNRLGKNEYSVLTNGSNEIYEIKIGIESEKKTKGVKKNRALIITDNLLLFPTSVAKMGETIYKQEISKVKETRKYKILGNKEKSAVRWKLANSVAKKDLKGGYKRTELFKTIQEFKSAGNEFEYLVQDVFILWKFHKLMSEKLPRKKWKMTIGGTAYKEWQISYGSKLLDKGLKKGIIETVTLKRGAVRYRYRNRLYNTFDMRKKLVEMVLPTKWLNASADENKTLYEDMYDWYSGGISFVNEKYRGSLIKNVTMVDINSSYPNQMNLDVKVPYGVCKIGGHKDYDFKFYTLYVKKKIVNKKGLPFLHNELQDDREYLTTLQPDSVYKFTTISLERFLKHYNPDDDAYELKINYSFKSMSIKEIFGDFIEHWYGIKESASLHGDEILKNIAKLFLNNVYGKFGTNIIRDSKIWDQYDNQWKKYTKKLKADYYLPLAIAITELARMQLVDGVADKYDKVAGGDTDSLAFTGLTKEDLTHLEFNKTKLGAWGVDIQDAWGVFRRPKQYFIMNETKHKMACAGINFNRLALSDDELKDLEVVEKELSKVTLIDFVNGRAIEKQLTPHRLLGEGLILEDTIKHIKPVWDFPVRVEQTKYLKEHFKDTVPNILKWGMNHRISVEIKNEDFLQNI